MAHILSFIYMRDHLTAELGHLTADQSSDGKSDAEEYLRAKWYALMCIYFVSDINLLGLGLL